MTNPDPAPHDALLARARAEAEARGWPWLEPLEVAPGLEAGTPVWIVRSHAGQRGRNVRVLLRRDDLEVLDAAYLPR